MNRVQSADPSSRERLLDVALELFASRGYAATSTAEIQKALAAEWPIK